MKFRLGGVLAATAAFVGMAFTSTLSAAPVTVELSGLRAIQSVAGGDKEDAAYLLVTGTAKGKQIEETKLPKEGTLPVARKKPGVEADKPLALWTGDLAEGEFAVVTVTVFHGKGDDAAKTKEFTGKLADASKKVPALAAAKLASLDERAKLAEDLLKAQREVIVDIKKLYPAGDKSDHFAGQFTLIAWNNAGKVNTRLDPIGLTFGEHYGTKEKIYSKIKNTRQNVLVADGTGEFSMQTLGPVSDDEADLRVKMLETVQLSEERKKVVDYIAEVRVTADGKPLPWALGGEKLGISDVHTYWEFAESKKEKVKK